MSDLGDSSQTTNYGAIEHGQDATTPPTQPRGGLHRGLSARQVQMIAIAGTIGQSPRVSSSRFIQLLKCWQELDFSWVIFSRLNL
jgi:amino acid permease